MFSGIGGFEYGLQQSKYDFENVGYCEIDKYAVSIYERHYPNHINYGDATKLQTETIPDFDFLVGGFPCQAFSIAGKRRGFDDTRGTLFFEIARVLKDKKPRYFLLENVKGLLSHEGGETIQTIFQILDELRYDVSWRVYNSKDYGVPQNRERIFIKGYLRGKCGQEVLHQSGNCKKVNGKLIKLNNKAQAQSIYDINGLATCLSANGGGQGGKTGLYKINKIGNINPSKKHQSGEVLGVNGLCSTLTSTDSQHPKKIAVMPDENTYKITKVGNVSPTGHHNGDVFSTNGISRTLCARDYKDAMKIAQPVLTPERENKRQNGRRMKNDGEPMFTLTAQDKHEVYDGYRIRKLTPVECERLQGFPDNWTKYGKDDELISDTQRYKCCGNAVTTNVITAIVDEMFDKVITNE